jgi:hypothetical protein
MANPEFRPRRRTIQEAIAVFPQLKVTRDSVGFVHVLYPHTSSTNRALLITPFVSPIKEQPYVSIEIYDSPSTHTPVSPTPVGRFILKPVTDTTFAVDNTEAGDISFETVLRPARQGLDLLQTYLAYPPMGSNLYIGHVTDEIGSIMVAPEVKLEVGARTDYMDKVLRGDPILPPPPKI